MIHLERIITLRQSDLFQSASLEKVSLLAESLSQRVYSDSDFVLKEGDECRNLYLVAEGKIRVSHSGEDYLVRAGETFGELAVFHDDPLPMVAKAEGKALVLEIDGETYRKALTEEFDLAENLLRSLARRIISLAEKKQKESP